MKKNKSDSSAKDLVSEIPVNEYAESFIDVFIEGELLKEVPIVSTVYGMSKAYRRYKESKFKRKVDEFRSSAGTYTREQMNDLSARLEEDGKVDDFFAELVDSIDRVDSEQKAKILGGAFRRLVNKEIDISMFQDQSKITNAMMLMDIYKFMHGYHNNYIMEEGLGDILLILRMSKRDISLASRRVSLTSMDTEQYIKVSYELTGIGKSYLKTLHQVHMDKIAAEHFVG